MRRFTSNGCAKCNILISERQAMIDNIEAFKALSSLSQSLSPTILITNLEKILGKKPKVPKEPEISVGRPAVSPEPFGMSSSDDSDCENDARQNYNGNQSRQQRRQHQSPFKQKAVVQPQRRTKVRADAPNVFVATEISFSAKPNLSAANPVAGGGENNLNDSQTKKTANDFIAKETLDGRAFFTCLFCKKVYSTKPTTRRHILSIHPDGVSDEPKPKAKRGRPKLPPINFNPVPPVSTDNFQTIDNLMQLPPQNGDGPERPSKIARLVATAVQNQFEKQLLTVEPPLPPLPLQAIERERDTEVEEQEVIILSDTEEDERPVAKETARNNDDSSIFNVVSYVVDESLPIFSNSFSKPILNLKMMPVSGHQH